MDQERGGETPKRYCSFVSPGDFGTKAGSFVSEITFSWFFLLATFLVMQCCV